MSRADWLVAFIGVVYAVVGADYLRAGQRGLGVAYLAYAVANVGLLMAALEGRG